MSIILSELSVYNSDGGLPSEDDGALIPAAHRQNFTLNAIEAQIVEEMTNEDGTPSETGTRLDYVDTAFTAAFTAELAVNAYAHWFR
jgi:hypothetical protein